MAEIEIDEAQALCDGRWHAFYGVADGCFKLDGTVYEALEDESDGYRSYYSTTVKRDGGGPFFDVPLDYVQVSEKERPGDGWGQGQEGFVLRGRDGHEWLFFGTDHGDGYYPSFVFEYQPRTDVPIQTATDDELGQVEGLVQLYRKLSALTDNLHAAQDVTIRTKEAFQAAQAEQARVQQELDLLRSQINTARDEFIRRVQQEPVQ